LSTIFGQYARMGESALDRIRRSRRETEAAALTYIKAQGGSAPEIEFLLFGRHDAAVVALRDLVQRGALVRSMIGARVWYSIPPAQPDPLDPVPSDRSDPPLPPTCTAATIEPANKA
jgi:hypothetical protein